MNRSKILKISLAFLVVICFPSSLFAAYSDQCSLQNLTNITVSSTPNNFAGITTSNGNQTANITYKYDAPGECKNSAIFCITPSMSSQHVMNYTLASDDLYNVSNCTSSKDTSTKYCGMAGILQEAYGMQTQVGSYEKLNGAITLSLRLWAATERKDGGQNGLFDDSNFNGDITKAANYIWDTVNSGGQVSTDVLRRYFPEIKDESDDVIQLAVQWYASAAKGVDIQRADDFINDDYTTVKGEGSDSVEFNVNGTFQEVLGVTIDGVESDQIVYSKKPCSDGAGECLSFDVTDEMKAQLCEGKPNNTEIPITVKTVSSSAVDKMRVYKPSTNGSNQYFVGFDAYDNIKEVPFNITCEVFTEKCEVENGVCKIGDEVVQCASSKEEAAELYPESDCYCEYDETTQECKVGGTPVNCEEYPGCGQSDCEVENGVCKIGDEVVPCANTKEEGAVLYPNTECYCEYDEDTQQCTIDGTPVNCDEYPGCKKEKCEVENGVCKIGDEVVPCANNKEAAEVLYPDSDCYCEYDESTKQCTVDGTPVNCDDYPDCKDDVCVPVNGKCYIGDQEVSCDIPECECERVGDDCFIGESSVDCGKYENCPKCEKVGDICKIGDKIVNCGTHADCPKDDDPGTCPIRKQDELPYDTCKDGQTDGLLADPPMCSILKNNIKAAYEIEQYGDSKYCDVFCRETYVFKFMDKEAVQSGRYFRHDVEKKYVNVSNLSTVVTSTQQCTSLIDYDTWKQDYINANRSVREAFNEVKYWESLYNLNGGMPTKIDNCGGGASGCNGCYWPDACGDWGLHWNIGYYGKTDAFGNNPTTSANEDHLGRPAQCPQLVCTGGYDSRGNCLAYSCVGASVGPALTVQQASGIDRDYVIKQHAAAVSSYRSTLNTRNDLINRIFNCNFFDPSEVSQYFNDPGSYFVSMFAGNHTASPKVTSETYGEIRDNYEPNSEIERLSYDEQGRLKEEGSASNVQFDKLLSDERIVENKGYVTSAESNNPEDNTVCGGCDDPINNKLSSVPRQDDEYGQLDGRDFTFWVCTGSLAGAKCNNESGRLKIPKNYVANMEVTRETGYWQRTNFATEIFTGKVVEGSGGLQLPEKSWPVAISTLTGDYNIFLKFTKFGDLKRKNGTLKLEFDTDVNCGYTVINEMTKYDCDDGYHECYDCDDPSTPENECFPPGGGDPSDPKKLDLGFYFRSIDLTDIFPNSVYSPNQTLLNPNRPIGSNWNTPNAIQAINKIQDLGNGVWGVDQKPEYVITLTPAMRKAITKNNREIYKADYLTASTLSCNQSTAICSSTWLQRDLRNILQDFNHGDYFVQNDNSGNNLYVVGRN